MKIPRIFFHHMVCGSFENEALENENRSTKHPNFENDAPNSRKRSTQNSKTKHPRSKTKTPKSRKRRTLDRKRNTQITKIKTPKLENEAPESGGGSGCVRTSKGPQNPSQGFIRACQLFNWTFLDRIYCINFIIGVAILDTFYLNMDFFGAHTCLCRLQNRPSADFGVFKYAWAVIQKLWNEAENGVWGSRVLLFHHALPTSLLILRKKPIILQSNILDMQEVMPPPDRKIINLLTFDLLFSPLRYYR